MKKIGIFSVALLLSLTTFSNKTAMNNNMSVPDLESSTTDFINEKSNIKKVSLRDAIRKSDSFKASKIYFQTASDSDGYEYLRFAAGLSGSYSKVSFTRNVAGLEDKTDEVTTLYKGITVNGKVLYTNGDELLSENVESTKNYYWSCYTIRFKSDSTYKDSDITLTLNVDDKYTDSRTISLNNAKNYVEDNADITINELKTYRMEAENLDFSKATLRDDFAAAGRTFIETPTVGEASGGKSICGYKPGSVFEISLNLLKESTLYITSSMSDTETNYTINDGVKFEMDSTVMTAEDMSFTFHGHPNYWEWKEVVIGKITLPAGEHTFKMTSVSRRPNIDYFDFEVLKYGTQEKEKVLEELVVGTLPTKTKYEAGEIFDPTGMVIKAKYSDYTYVDVTNYTIDKTGPLSVADTGITVSYEGKTVIVPIEVGKAYDVKLATLGDHIFEAENIKVDDNWILRSDMAGFGRNFSISNSTASGGKSIERYDVGTKMTIEFYVGEDATLALQIAASNYTNFTFDEKVEVKIDGAVLTSNNPTFGARYSNDYWNWVNVKFEERQLTKGEHVLTIDMKAERPNLDFVNFHIKQIGDQQEQHNLSRIAVSKNPTKIDYLVGETFDATGMEVKAIYDDATEEVITDYVVDKTGALTLDDTTIKITYLDKETTLTITVKNVDFEVNEAKSVKLEAEEMDLSNLVSDGSSLIENNNKSSNNASVGHINSGYINISFNVTFDSTLTMKGLFSKYEVEHQLKHYVEFKLDGVVVDYDDIALGRAEDGSNDWFNWKEATVNFGDLTVGAHTITINFKSGCNFDCATLTFAAK